MMSVFVFKENTYLYCKGSLKLECQMLQSNSSPIVVYKTNATTEYGTSIGLVDLLKSAIETANF